MPDDTKPERPTRAAMDSLVRRVELLESLLATAKLERDEALEDRDRWRAAHAPDAEAEALAGCVRAIGGLLDAGVGGRNRMALPALDYWPQPSASSTPVGRVLLHLAGRYNVPLQETPPSAVTVEEADRLVLVAPAIADQLLNVGSARLP